MKKFYFEDILQKSHWDMVVAMQTISYLDYQSMYYSATRWKPLFKLLSESFSSCYFQGMATTNEIHSQFLKDSITTSGLTWPYLGYHKA